jgi:hypothetical protein
MITETPPLDPGDGRRGAQGSVPVTGAQHAKRILPGVLNVQSGAVLLCITDGWTQEAQQAFLCMMRRHGRGWNLVRLEARGSPQTAAASLRQAKTLRMEVRFLPRSPPELHAMDPLWRHVKGRGLANRATASIDKAADDACQYLLAMSCRERLQKAGVLSGNFWLAT